MLGIMRKYKQSIIIKIVFGIIVLSFIGTIFLVWGKGDSGLKGSSGYAIKVDKTRISYEDYQQAYYRLRNNFQQMFGTLTPEMEKQYGLKKIAMDSLIDQLLVKREAKKMGISVSRDEIVKAISAIGAFQKDGVFNFDQYQRILKSQRMTPAAFEQIQEEDLLIKKAQEKIKGNVKLSDEDLLAQYKQENDRVDLSFVSFSPAGLEKEVTLTDQELQAYLQGHQDEFRTPEQVSISYLLLEPAAYAGSVTVTEDEANAYYQKHMDRYQGAGGIRPYAEVKEQVRRDAVADKAARLAYEKGAEAVNKFGKGGDLAGAASALGVRSVDTPLFAPRGVYLLKLKEKKPAAVPPLAEVRKRVEDLARKEKARELARKKAGEAIAQLGKGAAPGLQETGPFLHKDPVPKIGASPELADAAFKLTTAAPVASAPVAVNGVWYAVRLKSRIEASRDEFARQKEAIRTRLLPQKQEEALRAWTKGLRDKATIVINPALLAE